MVGTRSIRAEIYSTALSEPLCQILHDLRYERPLDGSCKAGFLGDQVTASGFVFFLDRAFASEGVEAAKGRAKRFRAASPGVDVQRLDLPGMFFMEFVVQFINLSSGLV